MSIDYTQSPSSSPAPVPLHPSADTLWSVKEADSIKAYGHACAEAARAPLLDQLGQCFRLSGSDPDEDENWRLAPRAVEAVRQLRADYDESIQENFQLEAKISQLFGDVLELRAERDTQQQRISELASYTETLESSLVTLRNWSSEQLTLRDSDRDRLRAEVEALRADAARLDSGTIRLSYRSEWGDSVLFRGVDLRAAIDAAIAARKGEGSEPDDKLGRAIVSARGGPAPPPEFGS